MSTHVGFGFALNKFTGIWRLIIINWENGKNTSHNIRLSSMLNEVIRFSELMEVVVFKHIYRERNIAANELAEDATTIQEGFWHITNYNSSKTSDSILYL